MNDYRKASEEVPPCWVCGGNADSGCLAFAGCQDRACSNHGNRDRATWIAENECHYLREEIKSLKAALVTIRDNFHCTSSCREVASKALEVDTELHVQPDLKDVQIRDLGGLVLELQQQCCKLRALVEQAIPHIGCSCMDCDVVHKECKEALK